MKPYIPILLVLMLVSASFVGISYSLEKSLSESFGGNIFYVGGSGEGNYTKIQDAIDNASDGDTVYVYNGTYVENLEVNKSINLFGEDRNITIIDGQNNYYMNVTAYSINITDFSIKRMKWGMNIESTYANITQNIINITYDIGIDLDNCQGNILENIIYSGSSSISGFNLHSSIISGNIFHHDYIGIHIMGDDNVISNNIILKSSSEFVPGDIVVSGGSNIIVNNSLLGSNRNGIVVEGSLVQGNNIIMNNIIKSYGHGISVIGAPGFPNKYNTISGNIISDTDIGILFNFCSRSNISTNSITNSSVGIFIGFLSCANKIYHNNLINTKTGADFNGFSLRNTWDGNYWNRPRLLPKLIIGTIGLTFLLPYINFDWNPAKEPYDLEV